MGFWDTIGSSFGFGKMISFYLLEDVEGARQMLKDNGIRSSSPDYISTGECGIVVSHGDYKRAIKLVNEWSSKK